MKSKTLITRLEKMGSLSQIIWTILAVLLLVYLVVTFYDVLFPDNTRAFINWGRVDLKSQLP